MNALVPIFGQHFPGTAGGGQIVFVLDRLCHVLEPTRTQYADVTRKYEAVGGYLTDSNDPMFRTSVIFPHGSFATGTALRPLKLAELDVDLIWHVPDPWLAMQPATLKKALGDMLRAHGTYRGMLEEKARCWRLNYAGEFHMDITPSVPNEACRNGGCLVPDKELRRWKESHPLGFRKLFEERAKLLPRFRVAKSIAMDSIHSRVEPFPGQEGMSGYLRRIVQLGKRSRDIYFDGIDIRIWPISVIITTLVARSYEWCVTNLVFEDELELLCEVVGRMADFIDAGSRDGRERWCIWNETSHGENFAEKWNLEPDRVEAFFAWHVRLTSDLADLRSARGIDTVRKSLGTAFGTAPVTQVFDGITAAANAARRDGSLAVAPGLGLAYGTSARSAVRPNTFFGRE